MNELAPAGQKNRITAIIWAVLLGGFGAHRFYVGEMKAGFVMLIFFWTMVPAFWAIYDLFQYAKMSDQEFWAKYG